MFTASKTGQAPRTFAFNEGFERLPDQTGFFLQAGECLSLGNQLIIEGQGRSHSATSYIGTTDVIN